MERNALLQADYLDIIYDHRNKTYGGYELRKHYPQRVKKAVAAVLLATGIICAYTVFGNNTKPENKISHDYHPTPLDPPPIIEQEKPKIISPEPPRQDVASRVYTPPEIVPNNEVNDEDKPAENDDLKDKMISNVNHDGPATGTDISVPPGDHPTGGGDIIVTENTTPPAAPVTWVPQMPQFNGDLEQYLASNIHYPEAAREANIEGRVAIQFVVDEQGNISEAHILKGIGGGCDQEAMRVVKNMPRWKPGKNNGTAVKVLFTLPITFTLN